MTAIDHREMRVVDRKGLIAFTSVFALFAFLLFVAAVFFTVPIVQASLLAAAIVCVFGTLKNLAQLIAQGREADSLKSTVENLVAHDPDMAFLTSADGDISACSEVAQRRFAGAVGKSLTVLLTEIIASPDAVLYRLLTQAETTGSAKDVVATRSGHFRVSVIGVDKNEFLWRICENSTGEVSPQSPGQSLGIPMMTFGTRGAVLFVNETCRTLLGFRPKSAAEVFADGVFRNGCTYKIKAANAEISVTVAIVETMAGRREIYLIP